MILYNSAIKNKTKYYDNIEKTSSFEQDNNFIFCNDLINLGLTDRYTKCDFLYSEPPYPHGFKVFEKRAEKQANRTYDDFVSGLNKIIIKNKKPLFLVMGKILLKKVIKPNQVLKINLSIHNSLENLAVWNYDIKENIKSTDNLMNYFAKRFVCMGDFCCGYGRNVMQFIESGGKNFVASDIDAKCITVLKKRMMGEL